MTTLNLNFADPNGSNAPRFGALTATIQQAFAAWMSHMDAPLGAVTINVKVAPLPPGEAASALITDFIPVGGSKFTPLAMTGFAYEIATGARLNQAQTSATLAIDQSFFDLVYSATTPHAAAGLQVIEHEIGHFLGFYGAPSGFGRTLFDNNISYVGGTETFTGPNAVAQYGRAIPMDAPSYAHPYVPGSVSVMSYLQQAATIQSLDVAVLRDSGLAMLSDQEVAEHSVARLYLAGLGRGADGPGLLNAARALLNGTSLNNIADGILTSPEYAAHYGAAVSDTDYVTALYANVLHRAPDAPGAQAHLGALAGGTSRTTLLISFADSPENRAGLEASANTAYAATAEAQMERLYDTAFGRAPDSSGYSAFTHAILNGMTLQQAAMSFIGSPEFAQRYGGASDKALVDAYYVNTLHRAADAPGEANFLDALRNGRLSQADLMISFSESPEHLNNVIARDVYAPVTQSTSVLAYTGVNPHLGSIPVFPV